MLLICSLLLKLFHAGLLDNICIILLLVWTLNDLLSCNDACRRQLHSTKSIIHTYLNALLWFILVYHRLRRVLQAANDHHVIRIHHGLLLPFCGIIFIWRLMWTTQVISSRIITSIVCRLLSLRLYPFRLYYDSLYFLATRSTINVAHSLIKPEKGI